MLHFLAWAEDPVAVIWLGAVVIASWMLRKRQWRVAVAVGALVLVTWIIGGTPLPERLVNSLEQPYAGEGLDKVPVCDAVVMLGGAHRPSKYDAFGLDVTAAGDRIVTAFELMRLKKGGTLAIGGNGYWLKGEKVPEGKLIEQWFAAWHISDTPVVTLGVNENTHDEALHTQALVKEKQWKRVIIVTSAFHMRRAEATFQKAGVSVVPVACDFQTVGAPEPGPVSTSSWYLFPRLERFKILEMYLHETFGSWVYRWRGWMGGEPGAAPATTNDAPKGGHP